MTGLRKRKYLGSHFHFPVTLEVYKLYKKKRHSRKYDVEILTHFTVTTPQEIGENPILKHNKIQRESLKGIHCIMGEWIPSNHPEYEVERIYLAPAQNLCDCLNCQKVYEKK